MSEAPRNLLVDLPVALPDEIVEVLLTTPQLTLERIVSRGQASPAEGWYDQPRHEWVLVLQGRARLAFEDGREYKLGPGDSLLLPAHTRHRVSWTDPATETVWLAIHYG